MEIKKVNLKNGETLGYREQEATGRCLVLIHGNMTSSKHFDVLLEALPSEYHLLAPDLRGFGKSSYQKPINSLADLAEDIKELLDIKGFETYSLLGWSTGGGVAMEIAADRPEDVEKLILLESVSTRGYPMFEKDEKGQPIPDKLLKTKEEIASDPVKTIPISQAQSEGNKNFLREVWNNLIYTHNQPEEEKYEEYLEDMLTQRNLVDIYYALAHFNISDEHNGYNSGSDKAKDISAPTLVFWGENDLIVTEDMARQTARDIGENAKMEFLEGCGHSPLIDDLKQLTDKIITFLEE